MNERKTFVTPGVFHITSRYDSILKMRKNYCYLLIPGANGVYFRWYICLSWENCKDLKFLKCSNLSCSAWKFQEFTLNQKTFKTYFWARNATILKLKKKKIKHLIKLCSLLAKFIYGFTLF